MDFAFSLKWKLIPQYITCQREPEMKQIRVESLLASPQDIVTFQSEWSKGRSGGLLLLALFAGNVGPGLYMMSFLMNFTVGMLVGFLIVAVGYGLPHLLFLGRKERFWRGVMQPDTSWISRGFIFANFFMGFACLTVALGSPMLTNMIPEGISILYNPIGILSSVFAFLLAMYPGFLFASVRAIPFWHSFLLVPLFIVQAFGSGIALLLVLAHAPGVSLHGGEHLLFSEAIFLVTSALLILGHLFFTFSSGKAGRTSVMRLISGSFKKAFLLGALSCEIAIPLTVVALTFVGLNKSMLIPAELIQLCGIYFFKYCFLNAGAYNEICSEQVFDSIYSHSGESRPFN